MIVTLTDKEAQIIMEALDCYQAELRDLRDGNSDADFDAIEEVIGAVNDLEFFLHETLKRQPRDGGE